MENDAYVSPDLITARMEAYWRVLDSIVKVPPRQKEVYEEGVLMLRAIRESLPCRSGASVTMIAGGRAI